MPIKFSIITPSLNQGRFIRDTIESVLLQKYDEFEHIIIDGGSSDDTLNILQEYPHLKWISRKDKGPAYAINKGFEMASGDIFAWINADDYYEENAFLSVSEIFEKNTNVDIVCGDLTYVDENKNIILKDKTVKFDINYLINISADVVRQPSTFFKKKMYQYICELNTNLKYVFDYDLFIRMLQISSPYFLDANLAYYREYSETITRKGLRKQAIEICKVSRSYGARLFSPINKTVLKKLLFPDKFIVRKKG